MSICWNHASNYSNGQWGPKGMTGAENPTKNLVRKKLLKGEEIVNERSLLSDKPPTSMNINPLSLQTLILIIKKIVKCNEIT